MKAELDSTTGGEQGTKQRYFQTEAYFDQFGDSCVSICIMCCTADLEDGEVDKEAGAVETTQDDAEEGEHKREKKEKEKKKKKKRDRDRSPSYSSRDSYYSDDEYDSGDEKKKKAKKKSKRSKH